MTDVVLKDFTDLQDDKRLNEAGHFYPREGLEVTEERKQELRDKGFTVKVAVDVEKDEDGKEPEEIHEFPHHKGGGNYVLSNGESVKGKDAAIEAENNLKSGE